MNHVIEKQAASGRILAIRRIHDQKVFSIGDKICNTLSLKEKKQGYVTINGFSSKEDGNFRIWMDTGFIDTRYHDEDSTHFYQPYNNNINKLIQNYV